MIAYKIKGSIDEQGNMLIHNLPIKNKESVDVIILVPEKSILLNNKKRRIEKLKALFGTINSETILADTMLLRENLYENDGR